ncbi:hypothetical protein [Desulfofustis phage LS06-2018-MD01]|nr:hypothetical protein [Desulfofustis phage LS06-2018-MD01]
MTRRILLEALSSKSYRILGSQRNGGMRQSRTIDGGRN